ncbi:hypothetical protein M8J75_010178 [Diaphorina citri]|nr:hypothetical protein M8J75_010178 [Diaphorina citri]
MFPSMFVYVSSVLPFASAKYQLGIVPPSPIFDLCGPISFVFVSGVIGLVRIFSLRGPISFVFLSGVIGLVRGDDEISCWEFTYRPRAGDSGRDVVDVVEDYLGYPVTPPGKKWHDFVYTSGDTADYQYVTADKHDPDCSSYERNIRGTIPSMGRGKKKETLKSESFYDIVTQNEIVLDRTLLMTKIFTKNFNKHIHLHRPPGWGKTVALDMIRRFIGIEVDENGRPLPEDKKVNRILFEGGPIKIGNQTKILPTLKIGNRDMMVNRFGNIPIIFFSFKNVTGKSFQEVFENLKRELVSLFRSHTHLFPVIKSARFKRPDKELYLKFFKNKTDQISVLDVKKCFLTLTRATKHFYKRRPIVIFDDYDMPMRSSYEHIFGLKDDVWSIFDMVDSIWEPLINEYKDCRKVITAGIIPFIRHRYRVYSYLDYKLMLYNLDLHIGIRDPSTTQSPSREWTITKTPFYFYPTLGIDL